MTLEISTRCVRNAPACQSLWCSTPTPQLPETVGQFPVGSQDHGSVFVGVPNLSVVRTFLPVPATRLPPLPPPGPAGCAQVPTHWPGEAEGETDGVAEGGVDACAIRQAEGVDTQHWGDRAAVGAGWLRGHAGLVVLETYTEEGPAGARRTRAPAAAVAVPQQPLLVDELLQLQLKYARAPDLRREGA